jgi:oligopeptidase A
MVIFTIHCIVKSGSRINLTMWNTIVMIRNPLLNYAVFVPYAEVKAEHILPAIKSSIEKSRLRLTQILDTWRHKQTLTFASTLGALIEMEDITAKVWTPVENLLSLNGTDELRAQAEIARPLLVEFYNEYSLNPDVYQMIKDYANSPEAQSLTGEYKRHLENTLKDFKLSGAELEGAAKEEFKTLNLKLADLTQKFSDNVTDSKFELIITQQADLSGLPEDIMKTAQLKADEMRMEAPDQIPLGSYVFNLDYPSYIPFMKFADSSKLRKLLYIKYLSKGTAKASTGILGKNKFLDNSNLIVEIFAARLKQSQLLGYNNYAEVSLQTKMAGNPRIVKDFLQRLAVKTKKLAQKEYDELLAFQRQINYHNSENDLTTVYPWDKEYLQEKLRKQKYDFDTNLLKPYFELESCIHGMFDIAKALYQVDLRQVYDIELWDKDLRVYEVLDKAKRIGIIYMDLFPRDIKRQGAWVMPLVAASTNPDGSRVLPQCTLACNLTQPTADTPSLLTQMELVTLFHEFGHALHHLFSTVELAPLSGTEVEWDFVELPSQLNENFAWEKATLNLFAKHYQTGDNIPNELIDKMLRARFFNEGLACTRQLEFALFDLVFYMQDHLGDKTAQEIFVDTVNQYGVFQVHPETNFANSFSHIFAGGYAAGYYSYKWAEILEADAFSKFKQAGVLSSAVGLEYRDKILARGDSKASKELFVDFMGREPSEDALLERMGL